MAEYTISSTREKHLKINQDLNEQKNKLVEVYDESQFCYNDKLFLEKYDSFIEDIESILNDTKNLPCPSKYSNTYSFISDIVDDISNDKVKLSSWDEDVENASKEAFNELIEELGKIRSTIQSNETKINANFNSITTYDEEATRIENNAKDPLYWLTPFRPLFSGVGSGNISLANDYRTRIKNLLVDINERLLPSNEKCKGQIDELIEKGLKEIENTSLNE